MNLCKNCSPRKYCFAYQNGESRKECKFYQPMTNEEWFNGLTTAKKAEFLAAMVKEAIETHEKHGTTWHEAISWWDGWLNGEHHDVN